MSTPRVSEDIWIHSACDGCFAACGILAHRKDGVLAKIEGNPNCPAVKGTFAPKARPR